MYINFNLAEKKELSTIHVVLLYLVKQNLSESIGKQILEIDPFMEKIKYLHKLNLVEFIKGKQNEPLEDKIRLTKKGIEVLNQLETPKIEDEDLKIFDWLSETYRKLGKDLGNQKKTKIYIALFRKTSGINKNKLAKLCDVFIKDDSQMEYSNVLEYMFYKPPTMYSNKFDINESKLFKYYLKYKEKFDDIFLRLEDGKESK